MANTWIDMPASIKTYLLDKFRYGMSLSLDPEGLLKNVSVEYDYDILCRKFIFAIQSYAMKLERDGEKETVMRPKTWWQMLKATYFPNWLLRYTPVKNEEIVVVTKNYALCPHLQSDTEHKHIKWLVLGDKV